MLRVPCSLDIFSAAVSGWLVVCILRSSKVASKDRPRAKTRGARVPKHVATDSLRRMMVSCVPVLIDGTAGQSLHSATPTFPPKMTTSQATLIHQTTKMNKTTSVRKTQRGRSISHVQPNPVQRCSWTVTVWIHSTKQQWQNMACDKECRLATDSVQTSGCNRWKAQRMT